MHQEVVVSPSHTYLQALDLAVCALRSDDGAARALLVHVLAAAAQLKEENEDA